MYTINSDTQAKAILEGKRRYREQMASQYAAGLIDGTEKYEHALQEKDAFIAEQKSTIQEQTNTINKQASTIDKQTNTINEQASTIKDQANTIKKLASTIELLKVELANYNESN
ncbi:hypothetical protein [Butyrivibrio sp. YAB3001]|uniref:hypothetical protein n=1 Tax=Butyrivibrio sp. YAB3001 TaxID=1520812 RepID=UPI0008F67D12|nr:hypothetical protein [Butyrivibrio sp. YAB3001]SFB88740.1 hypothetical protein SAMN02910398_01014 [Butyrivibrio sp. YAB3001]